MILFKKSTELRKWLDDQSQKGSVGFVPTMGALHAGHISLVETSLQENSITLGSIFVNPTQFNDPNDFKKYPTTIEKDIDLLEGAGCTVLFLPSVMEMYGEDAIPSKNSQPNYDLGYLETILEGKYRPGHFQGVCMIVHRLLEIVKPNNLYLGQKDYQQCMVIKQLVKIIGMDEKLMVRICPTLRETGGLAMSSRNMRLTEKERTKANVIHQSLALIKNKLRPGNMEMIKEDAYKKLEESGFKMDYVEIADANDLRVVAEWDGNQKLVALAAGYLNEVRLIDNIFINP